VSSKTDFDVASWNVLRDTPQLVGAAMMMAGASGLGTIKETFAVGRGLVEGQASAVPLIHELNQREEVFAARDTLKASMGEAGTGDPRARVRAAALDHARQAAAILKSKATSDDLTSYRDWVYSLAEGVAKAAREGGVLGFGGVQVSPEEQSLLDELRAALNS